MKNYLTGPILAAWTFGLAQGAEARTDYTRCLEAIIIADTHLEELAEKWGDIGFLAPIDYEAEFDAAVDPYFQAHLDLRAALASLCEHIRKDEAQQ